jgi:hypothetical protein
MATDLAEEIRGLIGTGARPITLSEITAPPRTAPAPSFRPAPARLRLRLGWAAAVVAAVVAVGSTGVITATELAAGGHAAGPRAGRPASPAGVLLTAAQVRQVATASRSALAHSARAYITYVAPGPYHAFQSEDVAFSGENYSFAGSVVNSAASNRPGQVAWFAERLVNGRAYDRLLDGRGWHWFRYANRAGGQATHVLDPRAMLSMLAPGERFRFAGRVVIGGVSLERLAASDLANVPRLTVLTGAGAGESATALGILVDKHGVVHRVDISLRGTTLTAAARPRKPTSGRAALDGQGAVPLAPAGSTNMTVTFTDIGQPQVITVPWHAINERTPWGENDHPLPPTLMLSAGVAGS